jgi:hypothetical protein
MPRQYSMQDGMDVAKAAAADIERWLRGLPQTRSVANVEDDPAYQAMDVDLIWVYSKPVGPRSRHAHVPVQSHVGYSLRFNPF